MPPHLDCYLKTADCSGLSKWTSVNLPSVLKWCLSLDYYYIIKEALLLIPVALDTLDVCYSGTVAVSLNTDVVVVPASETKAVFSKVIYVILLADFY